MRRAARRIPAVQWLTNYSYMIETAILAFMVSGAFLGVVYLDVIYQMVGLTIVLKMLYAKDRRGAALHRIRREEESPAIMREEMTVPA